MSSRNSKRITSFLQNMAVDLNVKIGNGLIEANNATTTLANNIRRSMDTRSIEAVINRIPIYIIVAHSSLEVNYNMPNFPQPGNEKVCVRGEHSSFFTSNDGINGKKMPTNAINLSSWLQDEARFIYYPTPPGEAGGLQECPDNESERHILRNNIRNIRASILTGSNFLDTLKGDGIKSYGIKKTDASAFLPGSFIPDKKHHFNGDTLSFGGFGIIKLYNTGQNLDKSVLEIANDNAYILNDSSFYYISNKREEIPEWVQDIADKSQNEVEIPMSEIVRNGGPGFYISLSCSVLSSYVYPGCNSTPRGEFPLQLLPMPIDERGETPSLYTDISQFHDAVINEYDRNMIGNNILWKDFFNQILPERVSRGRETLEFSTFGDDRNDGWGATTRRRRKQRLASGNVARTRGIIARNSNLAHQSDYMQYVFNQKYRQNRSPNMLRRRRRRSQMTPHYQDENRPVCKPNSTNTACILGATAVGAKLGGIKGACVGAACGAVAVGTKKLLKKKKEKINGGRRKKTRKRRRKKAKSKKRKDTRRRKKH